MYGPTFWCSCTHKCRLCSVAAIASQAARHIQLDNVLTACGVLQDGLEQKELKLQSQVAMNQQLMKRKEDMEWQLMSVLAQVTAAAQVLTDFNSLIQGDESAPAPAPPPRPFCDVCDASTV